MKKILVIAAFLLISFSYVDAQPRAEVTFGAFYSSLEPYGEWVSVDGGVYAWSPRQTVAGWRPYTMGRWVWTDDGWFWASDEPWSWATYHYGRWYYDDYYGWLWIPGYDWAPAWVEWRYGGEYVGWAPLGPYALWRIGFGIHYARYWVTPYHYWSFVDCRYIASHDVHRYLYRTQENTRFIGRTRSAGSLRDDGGRIVTRGPEREYVERRGNVRVDRADLNDVNDRGRVGITRAGDRERIDVYRPRVEQRDAATERPSRVRTGDRQLGLDTRNTDIRTRDNDREAGRDLRRSEQYRQQNNPDVYRRPDDNPRMQGNVQSRPNAQRGNDRNATVQPPRVERRNDLQSDIRRAPADRPNINRGNVNRAPVERPHIDRQPAQRPREQVRAPERPAARPEGRSGGGGGRRDEGRRR